jgi:hypothetical protein
MRRHRLLLIAPMLALAACAAVGAMTSIGHVIDAVATVAGQPANPTANQTAVATTTAGGTVIMHGTQGLIVANNGYQAAAAIAEAYVRAGHATPAQLARIRMLNDRAIVLLEGGATGLTVAQRAAEVLNIVAELNLYGGRR